MNQKRLIFAMIALMLVITAGCAPGNVTQITIPGVSIQVNPPGPNSLVNTVDTNGNVAGILLGIWHGIISPVTLVLSFVNPGLQMYEVHNDGSQYNLGFLLGIAIVFLLIGAFFGSRRH
ncbi:MAG: hypothetical protein WCK35_01155 [Chloroflexota bacterium]